MTAGSSQTGPPRISAEEVFLFLSPVRRLQGEPPPVCRGGQVLLARSLLSATAKDLIPLLSEVRDALPVPISGAISDGQESIRKAVAQALPGVPHQLCHFHYLR